MQMNAFRKTGKYIMFVVLFAAVAAVLFFLTGGCDTDFMAETDSPSADAPLYTVVIDAGHGGEDGGTESAAGQTEKELNLAIALRLRDCLEAAGVRVVLTRTEDVLLYDRNVNFKGRKKALDLAARLAVGNKVNPDLYISIHMNAFPDSRYSGLQVWYSKNNEKSERYAKALQASVEETLQPDNTRRVKAAGNNIYLLDRLPCPTILVECGFLSNPGEAEKLSAEDYQEQLSFVIATSVLMSLEKETVRP